MEENDKKEKHHDEEEYFEEEMDDYAYNSNQGKPLKQTEGIALQVPGVKGPVYFKSVTDDNSNYDYRTPPQQQPFGYNHPIYYNSTTRKLFTREQERGPLVEIIAKTQGTEQNEKTIKKDRKSSPRVVLQNRAQKRQEARNQLAGELKQFSRTRINNLDTPITVGSTLDDSSTEQANNQQYYSGRTYKVYSALYGKDLTKLTPFKATVRALELIASVLLGLVILPITTAISLMADYVRQTRIRHQAIKQEKGGSLKSLGPRFTNAQKAALLVPLYGVAGFFKGFYSLYLMFTDKKARLHINPSFILRYPMAAMNQYPFQEESDPDELSAFIRQSIDPEVNEKLKSYESKPKPESIYAAILHKEETFKQNNEEIEIKKGTYFTTQEVFNSLDKDGQALFKRIYLQSSYFDAKDLRTLMLFGFVFVIIVGGLLAALAMFVFPPLAPFTPVGIVAAIIGFKLLGGGIIGSFLSMFILAIGASLIAPILAGLARLAYQTLDELGWAYTWISRALSPHYPEVTVKRLLTHARMRLVYALDTLLGVTLNLLVKGTLAIVEAFYDALITVHQAGQTLADPVTNTPLIIKWPAYLLGAFAGLFIAPYTFFKSLYKNVKAAAQEGYNEGAAKLLRQPYEKFVGTNSKEKAMFNTWRVGKIVLIVGGIVGVAAMALIIIGLIFPPAAIPVTFIFGALFGTPLAGIGGTVAMSLAAFAVFSLMAMAITATAAAFSYVSLKVTHFLGKWLDGDASFNNVKVFLRLEPPQKTPNNQSTFSGTRNIYNRDELREGELREDEIQENEEQEEEKEKYRNKPLNKIKKSTKQKNAAPSDSDSDSVRNEEGTDPSSHTND